MAYGILIVHERTIVLKANGLFEPLKVLRTLIAFGTKELEKFGFSILIFHFLFHSSVNSLSEAITPFNFQLTPIKFRKF